jgi:hypothetical protein
MSNSGTDAITCNTVFLLFVAELIALNKDLDRITTIKTSNSGE